MTADLFFLAAILALMIYLFLTNKLPVDLTAFAGLVILTATGYLSPDEAFSGFSSPAVITMFSTFFLGAGLRHTGLTERMARSISAVSGGHEGYSVLAVMAVAALFSAFMNDVAATAILLPVIIAVAMELSLPPSVLLMPLAFGTLLGGMTTLIGTPPNILAADMLSARGFEPFSFFDFTIPGILLAVVGSVYLAFFGRRILPRRNVVRRAWRSRDLAELYRLHERLFSLRIPAGSALKGKTLGATDFGRTLGAEVIAILRDGERMLSPGPEERLHEGDVLLVGGRLAELRRLFRLQGVQVQAVSDLDIGFELERVRGAIFKVSGTGPLGRSLRTLHFHARHKLLVVGIVRGAETLSHELAEEPLQDDDLLQVLGSKEAIDALAADPDFDLVEGDMPAARLLHHRLFVIVPPSTSELIGVTIAESALGELAGLTVVGLQGPGGLQLAPDKDQRIGAGDRLLVAGESQQAEKLSVLGELCLESESAEVDFETAESGVIEAVLPPRSRIVGKTIRELRFRARYGFQVLAIWKDGRPVRARFAREALEVGNALLLQGPKMKMGLLAEDPDFVVLSEMVRPPVRTQKAIFVVTGLALMILLSVLDFQPVHVATFIAATFIVLSGAITMQEGYNEVEWRVLFMVAALLPIGIAVENSGAAGLLAQSIVERVGEFGPFALLIAFSILASLISQLLDGSLTIVLLSPVCIQVAQQLGISPYPLMMAMALAASIAFLTPFSHKANLLVMAPGGYTARDYFKVGLPLTVITMVVLWAVVPILFPF